MAIKKHTDKTYDLELDDLRHKLIQLGGKVESEIAHSVRALTERDSDLAKQVLAADRAVNRLEISADDTSRRLLALRQPAASGPRLIPPAATGVQDLGRRVLRGSGGPCRDWTAGPRSCGLDRLEGNSGPMLAATHHPESPAGPNLVLVVDDDFDIREALSDVLAPEGYSVLTAADGGEALERLRGGVRPAVMLLDLMMPRVSGVEVIDALRKDESLS